MERSATPQDTVPLCSRPCLGTPTRPAGDQPSSSSARPARSPRPNAPARPQNTPPPPSSNLHSPGLTPNTLTPHTPRYSAPAPAPRPPRCWPCSVPRGACGTGTGGSGWRSQWCQGQSAAGGTGKSVGLAWGRHGGGGGISLSPQEVSQVSTSGKCVPPHPPSPAPRQHTRVTVACACSRSACCSLVCFSLGWNSRFPPYQSLHPPPAGTRQCLSYLGHDPAVAPPVKCQPSSTGSRAYTRPATVRTPS